MRPSQRLMAAGSLLLLSFGPTVSLTAQSQISPAPHTQQKAAPESPSYLDDPANWKQ